MEVSREGPVLEVHAALRGDGWRDVTRGGALVTIDEQLEALQLLILAKDSIATLRDKHAITSTEILIQDFLAIHCPDEEDPFS